MSAIFSEDRVYRYSLYRDWPMKDARDGTPVFIGLNPSTADEVKDDPTIRRCKGFAKSWGYRGMFMLNLFAFRATNPREMLKAPYPIGPDNNHWLITLTQEAPTVIAAWGRLGKHLGRDRQVLALLGRIHQIGKANYPRHPLYLKSSLLPVAIVSN